ncbi:PREDICTED: uncharacterized protein LOC105364160 [Ceratosolen solmsi marchali]|uniref:Uncharacterized protein LOC105364160 n=1 Tax=Ceratosolen solmsi marchali TaxID=326594 RepID=A0AAJ6YLK3_9HYME|nr:PREDICTED: uncharacterized protein LOC105364160 [Ceratosolen solmsi marchali]
MSDRLTDHRTARHFPSSTAPQNIVRPPTRKPCRCPTQFTPKITIDGVCECSCIEHDQDCLKLQRGKGYLSLRDRICIQNDQCTSPNCTFGEFITAQGRCPKKKDIFEANANHRSSFNYHHRRS